MTPATNNSPPTPQAELRPEQLFERLTAAAEENEALGRELLRCYEQLSLVFEITEHIATLQDPQNIQQSLLRRYATMLGASAALLDHDGRCDSVEGVDAVAPLALDPTRLRELLRDEIAAVRSSRRTTVPTLPASVATELDGAHVLLGALPQFQSETGVVIALRRSSDPPFDSSDRLAAESVLGYGGHILSNVLMVRHLQQTALETVRALANAIDAKDNYTHGHSERVGWLARMVGQALGMPNRQLQILEWAGLLHDVGKIGVPERILNKPGRLTTEEFDEMKRHPRLSYEVLRPVASLAPVLEGVLYHHENHDGSGYPTGLAGDAIPLIARVIHVVDIFDALTSSRSYRKGFTIAKAYEILRTDSGRVTDPLVTDCFLTAFERYRAERPADFAERFAHIAAEADPVPDDEEARRGR
ncbi:MAG: HD domain-containing protein [Planctomycetia bacterium]|nr:MAG: HD domain-containing protein [Planctomycetia bacterium]